MEAGQECGASPGPYWELHSLFTVPQGFLFLTQGSSSHLPATLSLLSEIGETQDLGNLFLLVLHVAGAGSRAEQEAWAAGDFFC